MGESRRERLGVRGDTASGSPAVGDHQEAPDAPGPPALDSSHGIGVSELAVKRPEHALKVGHHRLRLDDQKGRRAHMPGQDVDRSTLAGRVERHFGQHVPTRTAQEHGDLLDDVGVIGIKEPIGGFPLPIDPDDHSRVEHGNDAIQGVDAEPTRPTALNTSDE